VRTLSEFLTLPGHRDEALRLGIEQRLEFAQAELERVSSAEYLGSLHGTIGADPIHSGEARSVRAGRGASGEIPIQLN
jgi:hypothetical protein